MTDIDSTTTATPPAATAPMSRADHTAVMAGYIEAGVERARRAGNRGPLRLVDGVLDTSFLEPFRAHGFYVFEGVIDDTELAELRADAAAFIDGAPVSPDADVDARGRPALGRDWAIEPYLLSKPLADPWGGTNLLGGRHQTKMTEPAPDDGAPEWVPFLLFGMCRAMPSGLRLYGHPGLLSVAAAINGDDFVPYNDATFVKQPGVGGSVSWHQDGVTHWDNPAWDPGIHGFNFQVQLYRSTPANGLWIVPGSHRLGRIDIRERVAANGGSDLLPDAIPLFCEAGDVTIVNRQMLHASFANSSPDPRISLTFGFHRRSSVLGAPAALRLKPTEPDGVVYDEERISRRSSVIPLAVDARRQHHPGEDRFVYQPLADRVDEFRYDEATADAVLRDYNLNDLAI
ncbi:MAG: phytanoyl-CoA dioxygenase family protein [Acidimicrobiales bacterium]